MALRFLLISLVTALGFVPPSAEDVTKWTKPAQTWVLTQWDALNRAIAESSQSLAATEPASDSLSDQDFETIVQEMTDVFTIDLAALEKPKSKAIIVFEPITVPDVLDNSIAFNLNAFDLGAIEKAPYQLVGPPVELMVKRWELVGPPAPVVAVVSETKSAPTPNKIASALRLTRQAATAWMTLLQSDVSSSVIR
jgi:hypothetical protein